MDAAAARRLYLLSLFSDGRFVWPRHEAHDPKEYCIAHQGRCLQVVVKAGVADDPRIGSFVDDLIARQRGDGGWSVKPSWMYRPGEAQPAPPPSCWICTLEIPRGLGAFLKPRSEVAERLLVFWKANLNPNDVGAILALLEFCATLGMRVGGEHVEWLHALLRQARGPDGRYPTLPEYFEVLAGHLQWRLGAGTAWRSG